ncbi:protein-methionine-sulfoxide reductase heme-binding subunit MsrQ [Shewanella maritima]|uniref:Protein-methionine-sulfoxide reductase heme-binding subunit MsrQ n=1 Tax=Shewanella maritima TaxID=2520507 RepID=A0A411PDP2_9GAMM|nr:protein-methionine-sulfoxide reductase heme-binding subunit MsrQ [Shewanella maritima]QBF81624.1 protein-methionine-sulfoxide reductase heme-binding subunit MsrQ [Shewanella maritima]
MRLSPRGLWWLKAGLHLACLLPIIYLVYIVATDQAGGDPVQLIIHYTGMGTINSLLATMLVSPLAKWLKQSLLVRTRRLLGLYVFAYASLHIAAFLSLDLLFEWQLLLQEVVKRPYILVGAIAFVILLLLALTSFEAVKRKMGKSWLTLHRFIYFAAILAPVHFYWSVKSEIIEPGIYLLVFAVLLWLRRAQIVQWLKPSRAGKAQANKGRSGGAANHAVKAATNKATAVTTKSSGKAIS